jgi:hypothetical protein
MDTKQLTTLLELTWWGMFHPELPREPNVKRGADAIAALASYMESLVDTRPAHHRQYCQAVLSEVRDLAEKCFNDPAGARNNLDAQQTIGKVRLAFNMV